MKTQLLPLKDIIHFKGGGTPSKKRPEYWNGGIPWATVKDFTGQELSNTKDYISLEGLKHSSANLIPKGHVIIPTRMALGKAAINAIDLAINQDLRALIPKVKIHTKYLLYSILNLAGEIEKLGSGSTVKGITQDKLYNLKILFPPLNDQIRIAKLLGCVETMIAKRKESLRLQDELLKGIFLEMFGPSNPKFHFWPSTKIKDLAAKHKGAMRTGPFGSNLLHSEFADSGDVAVLGIDNAVHNRFTWGKRRFITKEKYKSLENYRIFPGDVIVTIMGTIGRSAVIPEDIPLAINTKHLAAITFDTKKANPKFISYSIHSSPYIVQQFAAKNRGAIMSGLNLGIIKETLIKKPPVSLQNQFAKIIDKVEYIKSLYENHLGKLEQLYGALSQKAFKGELDLSRIPLDLEPRNTLTTQIEDSVYSVSSVVEKEKDETLQLCAE
jgi:type I restriction enzyme S subunit